MVQFEGILCVFILGMYIQHGQGAIERNKYMPHHIYRKEASYSLYDCAAECQMSSVCRSFNYQTTTRICQLNDKNDSANLITRNNYVYSDVTSWMTSLDGPCSRMTCYANSRCVVDRFHRPRCEADFTGCGEPPDVAEAVKEYEGHFLSAVTSYECQGDYMNCQGTSVCRSSGRWDDIIGLCAQFRHIYPGSSMEYFYPPCGPTNKFGVSIWGTPTDTTRVSINMNSGNNILLHMDFRQNYWLTQNETVLNTYLDGSYGNSVDLPFVPLVNGREFLLEVSLMNGIYSGDVDGEHLFNYMERLDGASVDAVQVTGSVIVSRVEFRL